MKREEAAGNRLIVHLDARDDHIVIGDLETRSIRFHLRHRQRRATGDVELPGAVGRVGRYIAHVVDHDIGESAVETGEGAHHHGCGDLQLGELLGSYDVVTRRHVSDRLGGQRYFAIHRHEIGDLDTRAENDEQERQDQSELDCGHPPLVGSQSLGVDIDRAEMQRPAQRGRAKEARS